MIEPIVNGATLLADWFAAHPALSTTAWSLSCGVVATQGAKRWYPIWWPVVRVKQVSQSIAMVSAGAFAYMTWPSDHALPYAALIGLACPQVYTYLKLLLPNLMRRWGWACIVEQKADKA